MDREKILVVDDDPIVLRTISRILSCQGYETRTAHSREKALEYVRQEHFDLVLSDVRMPHATGHSAAQEISELCQEKQDACGFIGLTGFADDRDPRHDVKMVGVADLMMKPFQADKLIHAIEDELLLMKKKKVSASSRASRISAPAA